MSATTIAVAPIGFACGEVGRGTSLERAADELVSVSFSDDRNVELSRQHRSGVDARSRDGDVGPDPLPAQPGGELRSGESHASRSEPIV